LRCETTAGGTFGVEYDDPGRITRLPAKYSGGGKLETTFYVNDLTRSQTQDGIANTYELNGAFVWEIEYVEEKRKYRDPRLAACGDLLGIARKEDVAQITTFALDGEAVALAKQLRQAVGEGAVVHCAANFYWPGWTEITIQHRDAVKGAAIPPLLAACGSAGSEVVACGDHLNDLSMFAVAAHSIAPANAHPEVLECARQIVGSNDEDGVVRHLLDRHDMPHNPGPAA
jgi:hydroxymethylpyrimidine pyrophosphatase-like HAD family hydrolase